MQDENVDDNAQAWAHQLELEHQEFLYLSGCPDDKEIERYEDKHGV